MRAFAFLAAMTCIAAHAGAARAEPFTRAKAQIAANVVYGGAGNDPLDTWANPYGFGLGARAGYTLPVGLHLGASYEYYFGLGHHEIDMDGGWNVYALHLSNLMFEPGYDIALAPAIVLRPQLGAGLLFASDRDCGDCGESSWAPLFTATAGALLLYDFGPAFATAGLRYQQYFAGLTYGALLLSVGGGVAF